MTTVPGIEPLQIAAGVTWAWRRDNLVGDYPASAGWSLKYLLRNATQHYDIDATADGDSFAVSVAASTTSGYAAGRYAWSAVVTKGAEKHEVGRGTLVVLPDLTVATALDTRSHARKVLDAIAAVIENRATKDQMRYQIEGRELQRCPLEDLTRFRIFYAAEVAREEQTEKSLNKQGSARRVLTRFS